MRGKMQWSSRDMRRNAGSQKWTRENRCIGQSGLQTLQKTPDPLAILHRRKGCEQGTSISQEVHASLSGLAHLRWADKSNGAERRRFSDGVGPGLGGGSSGDGDWASRRILPSSSPRPPFVRSALRWLSCDVPSSSQARLGAMLGPAPKGTLDARLELGVDNPDNGRP